MALSVTGAPKGVTAQIGNASLAAGGNTTVQAVTPITMAATSFSLTVTATSGSFSKSVPITVNVAASTFTLTPAQTTLSINAGATGTLSVKSAHTGIFNSAVSLAWSGLPTGVTASVAPASLAAPGDGTPVTTFTVGSSVTPGTYSATLTATGGGITQTLPISLTVLTAPSCVMSLDLSQRHNHGKR